jgi:hypothetical protein
MKKMPPLISSRVSGPLGILHLPRLWLKASLDVAGLLADGYWVGKGFDAGVLNALNIPVDNFKAFMKTKPSYPQLEAWVQSQPGVQLDAATIHKINTGILHYHHKEENRKAVLDKGAMTSDCNAPDAATLNDFDDWQDFWAGWIK